MEFTFKRTYRGPVKAVIFDLAGTTVDYGSCAPAGAFVELFHRYKLEITTTQAREPMGMSKKDHIRTILRMGIVSEQWKQVYSAVWTESNVESMYQDFINIQMDCLPQYGEIIPGAVEALKQLKARDIKIGVTTGYNRDMMNIVLEGAAKQGFVPDSAFCASDVPQGRPAPWLVFQSMKELNIYPTEAVVKVGDTIPDIEGGLNAGVWTIGVAKTGNMIGLNREEIESISEKELEQHLEKARRDMYKAGAHIVIDGVDSCLEAIYRINDWLSDRKRP